jgi:hypothetical protein
MTSGSDGADGATAPPATTPPATQAFVVVGGDAAFCEGDVCTAPTTPADAAPLAKPPTT